MTPAEAEAAVAAIGLDRIMRGDASWAQKYREDAVAFPKRARALLLKALASKDTEPNGEMPDFDYDAAKALLEADDEHAEKALEAFYAAIPDDIQDDVEAAAGRAITYLQQQLPRRAVKTTARLGVTPPEPFELDRFARTWRVAVDPMWAIRMRTEGGLDMVMVNALADMYPELYALIAGREKPLEDDPIPLLDEALATMKARRGEKWDVSDDQDRQIKILLRVDPIDLDLANDFAAIGQQQQTQQAPARPRPTGGPTTDELLPGQKQT